MGVTGQAVRAPAAQQPQAQLRYSRWLDWGTRTGFIMLVASFAAYVSGALEPHVPLEQLPTLWSQPAHIYLELAGIAAGWGWTALAHRIDVGNLVGIAVLAGCSLPPLLAAIPLYLKQRDWTHAAICALEVGVVLLAASGMLTAGH